MPLDILDSGGPQELSPENHKIKELWRKIEKGELRNEKARLKVAKLHDKFNELVLPYERQFCDQIAVEVVHLIRFISKKSLSDEMFSALIDLIHGEMHRLDNYPFRGDMSIAELHQMMDEAIRVSMKNASVKNPTKDDAALLSDMLESLLGEEVDLSQEQLFEMYEDPTRMHDFLKKSVEEQMFEEESFDEDQDWQHFEFNFDESSSVKAKGNLFVGADQLNKMYKRLASILHPDKERDPDKKKYKHQLMQSLLEAKREGDVYTLLKLYHEYSGDNDIKLGRESTSQIKRMLEQQHLKVNHEHKLIFGGQGVASMVWKTFSDSSNKKIEAKMKKHILELKRSIKESQSFMADTKTLGKLKAFLRENRVSDDLCYEEFDAFFY